MTYLTQASSAPSQASSAPFAASAGALQRLLLVYYGGVSSCLLMAAYVGAILHVEISDPA